jgi:hypothetical protein
MHKVARAAFAALATLSLLSTAAEAQRRNANSVSYGIFGGGLFYTDDTGPALRFGALIEGQPKDFPLAFRGETEYQRVFSDGQGINVFAITGSGKFFFPRTTGKGNTPVYAIAGFGPYFLSADGDSETEFGFHVGGGYENKNSPNRIFFEGRLTFVADVVGFGGAVGMKF